MLEKLLKRIEKTVVAVAYANSFTRSVLREIEDAYKRMLQEMVEYAVEHSASQNTLHKVFYHRFRSEYPWLPTRIIKGCYRDATRRAKSFRRVKKKGLAKTDKPSIRSVTITYSDSQDWRFAGGDIELKTHRGWIKLYLRQHKQLIRYLYGGWRLAEELKIKLCGKRVLVYLTFVRDFEVLYNPMNVVAVDINENNVTLALFRDGKLHEVYRVETGLGRIVVAYAERRRKITRGKSTKVRSVKNALEKLRERERKQDIIYKTARLIEETAKKNNAVVVVGNVHKGKRRLVDRAKKGTLRHRIHQWSVGKLVEALNNKPIHVVEASEAHSSSVDPFTGRRITSYTPSMTRIAVRGRSRVKVVKIHLRLAKLGNGLVLDRDVIGAINIGLRYLSSDGRGMAFPSTGPHEVRVKLVSPHQGPAPLTELKMIKSN